MLLTITNRSPQASELGYLLFKHPARVQTFSVTCGQARVFYPEAGDDVCTVALLLEVDAVGVARNDGNALTIHDYVNDRPYVASSIMSAAIRKVFGSALSGACKDRPDLVDKRLALSANLSAVQCWGGEPMIRSMFEPLGYTVTVTRHQYDPNFPDWGESPYYGVGIAGDTTLKELLAHLYVLMPVLDNGKHYVINPDEVEKLLKHGEGWLSSHPEQRRIVQRYLGYRRGMADKALGKLAEAESAAEGESGEGGGAAGGVSSEGQIENKVLGEGGERPLSLHAQRHVAVVDALASAGVESVLDMGCNDGKLLERLSSEERLTTVFGFDVAANVLWKARRRCGLKGRPKETDRVKVFVGSLFYTDERMRGFDAATCVEVIEHLEPTRLGDFENVVFAFARPRVVVLTTPNVEYNVRFEFLEPGKLRHNDHRFEWTRAQFRAWCEAVAARQGYAVTYGSVGPDDPQVGPPSQMAVFTRPPEARDSLYKAGTASGAGGALAGEEGREANGVEAIAENAPADVLVDAVVTAGDTAASFYAIDAAGTLENRSVSTRLIGQIGLDYGSRCAAFETASTHTVDPRWMIYLPPTMSPSETSTLSSYLEHPADALAYYRDRGVRYVVCEEKHMGSRAVVVVCRDEATARARFGVESGLGTCYTRMGRPFFSDAALEAAFIEKVRAAMDGASMWRQLGSDWALLDCELMPWSAKAQGLIKKQYAALTAASTASFAQALPAIERAVERGLPAEEILSQTQARAECARLFREAYRPYCWNVTTLADYRLAPFHLLASEGQVHADCDHLWHMSMLAQVARASDGMIIATRHSRVDVNDAVECDTVTRWWMSHTESGGEGMVVKPLDYLTEGGLDGGDLRLVQPAVKCRGREYLRIIYSPEYDLEHNLSRLRERGLKRKRWLAIQELALGLEGLYRFIDREPLQRVHECSFAVLACECESVDPRL